MRFISAVAVFTGLSLAGAVFAKAPEEIPSPDSAYLEIGLWNEVPTLTFESEKEKSSERTITLNAKGLFQGKQQICRFSSDRKLLALANEVNCHAPIRIQTGAITAGSDYPSLFIEVEKDARKDRDRYQVKGQNGRFTLLVNQVPEAFRESRPSRKEVLDSRRKLAAKLSHRDPAFARFFKKVSSCAKSEDPAACFPSFFLPGVDAGILSLEEDLDFLKECFRSDDSISAVASDYLRVQLEVNGGGCTAVKKGSEWFVSEAGGC